MKRKSRLWLTGVLAVVLLGLWHAQDVRIGASACGDLWLTGVYWMLFAGMIISLIVIGTAFLCECRLEKVWLVAGVIFGAVYLLVLPPLSAPDEISHYVSAYKLSSVMLGKPSTARSGRVLLRPQDAWVEDFYGVLEYEADEDGNMERVMRKSNQKEQSETAVPLGDTLNEPMYHLLHEVGLTGQYMPERAEHFGGASVSSTFPPVVTTPLAYVPQAAGIALARILQGNTLLLLYMGRLFNLIFFVGMTYLAMRRMPFGKEVLFGVAMLPMTLHLSASFSYDVMILACMFCFTAVCLDLAYGKESVSRWDILILMLLMAAAGPCKMVYAPMMGLCLLIPVRKFGGWGRWLAAAAAVAGTWAAAMYLVNSQVLASYAVETESYVQWAAEPGYSLTLLLHQPIRLARMFYQTIIWQGQQYHLTMIGVWLGNLDEVLDVPYLVVAAFSLCLLGLAFRKPGESLVITGKQRIWIGVICIGCVAATMLSMLIAWTPLSSKVINGVQGRYFLPILPILLMALKNDSVVLTKDKNRSILYLMCCLNGYALLRLYSIVCLRL